MAPARPRPASRTRSTVAAWTSTTRPRKPPSAPRRGPGSTPTPSPRATPTTSRSGLWTGAYDEATYIERCQPWQRTLFDGGWAGDHLAQGVRRTGRQVDRAGDLQPGAGAVRRVERRLHDLHRHGGADDPGPRHRRAEGPLPAPDAAGRRDVVPALQRAGRRLGPGGPVDPRRARRRRVGRHRAEGVDLVARPCPLGDAARPHRRRRPQAPRHQLLPARHDDRPASTSGRCAR